MPLCEKSLIASGSSIVAIRFSKASSILRRRKFGSKFLQRNGPRSNEAKVVTFKDTDVQTVARLDRNEPHHGCQLQTYGIQFLSAHAMRLLSE